MPRATISTDFGERIPLETLEGGFVRLRPLPYGMKLERRDKASKMYMEWSNRDSRSSKQNVKMEDVDKLSIDFLNKWAAAYDFAYCIGEHNLEDDNGHPLDFSNPLTIDALDPRVGSELERLIGKINGEDDDLEGFTGSRSSSSEETTLHTGTQ